MRVLCTLAMDKAGVDLLADQAEIEVLPDASTETLLRRLPAADYLVVRTMLPPGVFEHAPRLKGVVRHGTGLDFVPVAEATALGIPVANVPGANAQAVVEYCVASMLSLTRGIDKMGQQLRTQGWQAGRSLAAGARQLAGKTVGIVGVGTVGLKLAQVCHLGFDMRVLGHQPSYENLPEFVTPTDLDKLLAQSDYVVLCCPLTKQTTGLVNAARLALMQPDAVLVNAARGPIVDEAVLFQALQTKKIKAAALDVYAQQPLAPDHALLTLDNVLLTPHIAGLTMESTAAMSVGTARQILQLMRGERPEHLVNPEIWDKRRTTAGDARS